jgi:hypothetical protein
MGDPSAPALYPASPIPICLISNRYFRQSFGLRGKVAKVVMEVFVRVSMSMPNLGLLRLLAAQAWSADLEPYLKPDKVKLPGLLSAEGMPLLRSTGWSTLWRLPKE